MKPRAPHSYDEITRRTVPDPDSSFRPPVPPDASSTIGLRDRVVDVLEEHGFFDVGLEVIGTRVLLRGTVRDAATRDRIEHVIAAVNGVERVDCTIHVG